MSRPNEHPHAEHTDRPAPFNHNPANVLSLWDAPNADVDMFTRWIQLSDDVLSAHRDAKKAAQPRRRRPVTSRCVFLDQELLKLPLECRSASNRASSRSF
ncbi:MAG: hypothetical protein JWN74_386 [Acidobacteriaceae bacterium]|nr:hypothetical protein [Acidobacteriaceae bacterium]